MPRYIVKIGDRYGEWSTIVDAPVTYLSSREEFRAYYEAEYGRSSMDDFERRMERVDAKGTSSLMDKDADSVMRLNRMGPKEGCISVAAAKAHWIAESDKYHAKKVSP